MLRFGIIAIKTHIMSRPLPSAQQAAVQVLILENVRFHKEETKNETGFAKEVTLAVPWAMLSIYAVALWLV